MDKLFEDNVYEVKRLCVQNISKDGYKSVVTKKKTTLTTKV